MSGKELSSHTNTHTYTHTHTHTNAHSHAHTHTHTQGQPPPVPLNQPPKYPHSRPGQRLGTPNAISPLVHSSGGGGGGGGGVAAPSHGQLSVPDPFTRKISRLPKKLFTQSSSRFAPQKPPPDYKPLPLLKGW